MILPLICHELFHNFRVLGRKERNDALARYLFRRIAQFIVRRWISQTAEKNIYHAFGRLEEELYIDELAVLLWDRGTSEPLGRGRKCSDKNRRENSV